MSVEVHIKNNRNTRVLVLTRESLVAPGVLSLSISARVTEVLDYIESTTGLEHFSVSECDDYARQAVAWADVVVLSKHRSVQAYELVQHASSLGKVLIYDLDDWIFSFPKYSGGRNDMAKDYSVPIIALCDCVTVANHELMKRLPSVVPKARLIYLPNGMWIERYSRSDKHINNNYNNASVRRIVFTNADFLKVQESKDAILTALNVFFIRHPNYVLDFFGDPFPEMFSLPFLHFTNRMPYQEYMRSIVTGDYLFAITPLGAAEDADSANFNACKNPFKYINYGVARIPGIYSSAKIYQNCVKNECTGLLVENTYSAWLSALEKYAADDELRIRVRDAAFEDVRNNYHVSAGAKILSHLIWELMNSHRSLTMQ